MGGIHVWRCLLSSPSRQILAYPYDKQQGRVTGPATVFAAVPEPGVREGRPARMQAAIGAH